MLRRLALALALLALPPAAPAAPVPYAIDRTASTVSFESSYILGTISGSMPLGPVSLAIDFQDVRRSLVAVTLKPRGATASVPYAAAALKGRKVLDAQHYPTITFRSTRVTAIGDAVRIDGQATIRGITRPLTLVARLAQVAGASPGDYRQLTIRLTGTVRRSAFGADGWEGIVSDEVQLAILARIDRRD